MATDYLILPDLEAIANYTLRNAGISGLGTRVYSSIPGSPTYPLVVVKRSSGQPPVKEKLDMARIQVDVWGGAPGDGAGAPTKSTIHDIAQLARVTLLRMQGQSFTTPVIATVTAVRDSMGIAWSPDPTTSRDRYIFAMNVYGQP